MKCIKMLYWACISILVTWRDCHEMIHFINLHQWNLVTLNLSLGCCRIRNGEHFYYGVPDYIEEEGTEDSEYCICGKQTKQCDTGFDQPNCPIDNKWTALKQVTKEYKKTVKSSMRVKKPLMPPGTPDPDDEVGKYYVLCIIGSVKVG